jgi:hypothetical protein
MSRIETALRIKKVQAVLAKIEAKYPPKTSK